MLRAAIARASSVDILDVTVRTEGEVSRDVMNHPWFRRVGYKDSRIVEARAARATATRALARNACARGQLDAIERGSAWTRRRAWRSWSWNFKRSPRMAVTTVVVIAAG